MICHYFNINGICKEVLLDRRTKKPINFEGLSKILPPSIAQLELSTKKWIDIPGPILDIYSRFRPTPLFRAVNLEHAINSTCEIYIKDEGATPTGNHKANSAYLLAYLCKLDGIKAITTETTGNWGPALAIAGKEFGLETICFIDSESNHQRPDRKEVMERLGAKVVVVSQDGVHKDLLTLSADAAINYAQRLNDATYIFGSVYGYFVVPQSIIGLS